MEQQGSRSVSYGSAGGVRAVEQLRLVMAEVKVVTVRAHVQLSLDTDFENFSIFKPHHIHKKSINTLLNELVARTGAMKSLHSS